VWILRGARTPFVNYLAILPLGLRPPQGDFTM
jgi:hypothetical protein